MYTFKTLQTFVTWYYYCVGEKSVILSLCLDTPPPAKFITEVIILSYWPTDIKK